MAKEARRKFTMKAVYLTVTLIGTLMLLLQFGILAFNSVYEADTTTSAYVKQTETIIEKNELEEEVLLNQLKSDYIVLAKAVAHYLDNSPGAMDDVDELNTLCNLLAIDEIHVFDETGMMIASSMPQYIGKVSIHDGGQISFFLPMLEDRTLSMCQDVTPNTADGRPMMYAMTWNAGQTLMVQVGVAPTRLLKELEAHDIQTVVENMAVDSQMMIIVADAASREILGSKNRDDVGKTLSEVSSLNDDVQSGFSILTQLKSQTGQHFCNVKVADKYCYCVFLNHNAFTVRIVPSMLIVLAYLLVAMLAVVVIVKRLISSREENDQHLGVFQSMSEIYYSLHLLDLKNNTAIEYSSRNQVKDAFHDPRTFKANELMVGIMHATMSEAYLTRGLEFTDLTTLAERMRGKKIISQELLGKNVGWIRMSFITFEEENGLPNKVIIATQIIDEEKKQAEALYRTSHIDELTGCFNRRAYNTDVAAYEGQCGEKDFAFIAFDVNGLKTANDDLGHEAGDELIIGASQCMTNTFGSHGRIYRTGGDEFVGLIDGDVETIAALAKSFDEALASWKGKLIKEISVSYGYVHSSEAIGKTMVEVSEMADKRMYECKAEYYRCKGIDRRRT